MVGVGLSHGINRVEVCPTKSEKSWRKGAQKWSPKGKMVKSP